MPALVLVLALMCAAAAAGGGLLLWQRQNPSHVDASIVAATRSGTQPAPEGSECQATPGGAQSCTQTVRVTVVELDGGWKISDLTVLATS